MKTFEIGYMNSAQCVELMLSSNYKDFVLTTCRAFEAKGGSPWRTAFSIIIISGAGIRTPDTADMSRML